GVFGESLPCGRLGAGNSMTSAPLGPARKAGHGVGSVTGDFASQTWIPLLSRTEPASPRAEGRPAPGGDSRTTILEESAGGQCRAIPADASPRYAIDVGEQRVVDERQLSCPGIGTGDQQFQDFPATLDVPDFHGVLTARSESTSVVVKAQRIDGRF